MKKGCLSVFENERRFFLTKKNFLKLSEKSFSSNQYCLSLSFSFNAKQLVLFSDIVKKSFFLKIFYFCLNFSLVQKNIFKVEGNKFLYFAGKNSFNEYKA